MSMTGAGSGTPAMLVELAASFADLQYAVQILPQQSVIQVSGDLALVLGQQALGTTEFVDAHLPLLLVDPLLDAALAAAAVGDTDRHALTAAHGGRAAETPAAEPAADEAPAAEAAADEAAGTDAPVVWLQHRWRVHGHPDEGTGTVVLLGAARDVTADVRAHDVLLASEQLYRQMAENSADFSMRTSPKRIIEYVSESVTEVLGWQPSDLIGHQTREFIHPDDLRHAKEHSDRVNAGEAVYLRTRFLAADGNFRWMAQHVRPLKQRSGEVTGRTGVWRDISGEMAALAALEASEETFRTAMDSAPSGIALLNDRRRFIAVNSALCDILRRDRDWLLQHGVEDVIHPDDDAAELELRARADRDGRTASTELRCVHADGSVIWVQEAIGIPQGQQHGEVAYVAHFVDITDERAARERLHFLAQHDDLTGALRPGAILAHLSSLLAQPAALSPATVAALYVDVDYLKVINDTYGHGVGDDVIRTVAHRIADTVRGSDLLARIGGDEFVVVLPQVRGAADVVLVGEKIRDACREPVLSDGHRIAITLSMGGALAEPDDDPEALLQRADRALYRSKRAGRNCLHMYDSSLGPAPDPEPRDPTPAP